MPRGSKPNMAGTNADDRRPARDVIPLITVFPAYPQDSVCLVFDSLFTLG